MRNAGQMTIGETHPRLTSVKASKRLLKHLTKINEQNKVEIFEIAITCLRSCYIIGRNTINKSEKKECLISDNLWAAFWLIQKYGVDISNSPVKITTKNNDNWCPQEDTKPKPSYWSEYCDENVTKPTNKEETIKSNNFNKWVIQCKCQAAIIELESFLGLGFEFLKGSSYPSRLIFEINVGERRIRHRTTPKFIF